MSMEAKIQKNVFGEDLEICSKLPLTGWYRDGCCNTDERDRGIHTVCAEVNDEFLIWCKEAGNDLITPHPNHGFPGLKSGDKWCVCRHCVATASRSPGQPRSECRGRRETAAGWVVAAAA